MFKVVCGLNRAPAGVCAISGPGSRHSSPGRLLPAPLHWLRGRAPAHLCSPLPPCGRGPGATQLQDRSSLGTVTAAAALLVTSWHVHPGHVRCMRSVQPLLRSRCLPVFSGVSSAAAAAAAAAEFCSSILSGHLSVQRAMHAIPLPLRTSFHHVRCMLLQRPSTQISASLCCTLLSLEQWSNVGAGSAAAPETLHAGHTKQHIQDMLMLGV